MISSILDTIRAARERRFCRSDPIGYARSLGVRVGKDCRLVGVNEETFGSEPYLITLGDHVTIAAGVRFVTHDGGVWVFRRDEPDIDVFNPIDVGNNVFIGIGCIILPGARIGADCVIGAGSVVKGPIAPGTIAAGVPAKPLRTLSQYREHVFGHAMHVRSLPEEQKRNILLQRFDRREMEAV